MTLEELEIVISTNFAKVERDVKKLRGQVAGMGPQSDAMTRTLNRNSDQLAAGFRRAGVALGAFFSVQKVAQLTDSYTRYTNSLKVAGLEGERLGKSQEQIFRIAQRDGVNLEKLGDLYGNLSTVQKDLNGTDAQTLTITSAVSSALKIKGATAEQASGAILGLNQALGNGKLQAEEYNQIIDGARPLLQAAVDASDTYRGSLGKLRADVIAGRVSSKELYDLILNAAQLLEQRGAKANLTLANSFVVLNNALGKYIGETDQSLSATERASQGIIALSNNLDTVIPAVAILTTTLGVGYVSNAIRAKLTTDAMTLSLAGMTAAARGAGAAVLAAFGGTVGIAITALAVAIGVVATTTLDAADATGEYKKSSDALAKVQERRKELEDKLAASTGKARTETLAQAQALRAKAVAEGLAAVRTLQHARAQVELQKALAGSAAERGARASGGGLASGQGDFDRARTQADAMGMGWVSQLLSGGQTTPLGQAETNLSTLEDTIRGYDQQARELAALIAQFSAPPNVATPDGKKDRSRSGPSAQEVERQFMDDLSRLQAERLQSELGLATNAEDRLEIQGKLLDLEYQARLADINAQKDFSAKQKAALTAQLNRLFGIDDGGTIRPGSLPAGVNREYDRQVADEARSIAGARSDIERRLLRSSLDLADSREDRARIELALLNKAYEDERRELTDRAVDETISEAKREEARLRLSRLDEMQKADTAALAKQYQGPLASYLDNLPDTVGDVNDRLQEIAVGGLRSLEDGFAKAAKEALGLKGIVGDLVGEMIRLVAQRLILNTFDSLLGGSGGGGGIFSFIGGLFGGARASGGPVAPGRTYLVGERGPEILRMGAQGGHVIPNHAIPAAIPNIAQMGKVAASGGTTVIHQHFTLDARGGITTPELIKYVNDTATMAGVEGAKAGHALARRDLEALTRPTL